MSTHGCYYLGTGTHQAQFKRLRAELVPLDGPADTPAGELLRAVAAVYHDLKRHGLAHVRDLWADWHAVYANRSAITAAIGPQGPWVFAVVDRAVTERYLAANYGDGDAVDTPPVEPSPSAVRTLPEQCFDRLIDGCVLVVRDAIGDADGDDADSSSDDHAPAAA